MRPRCRLAARPQPAPPTWVAVLSAREREVLTAVAAGHSNAEVGELLFVSTATVKTHVASLLSKLGVRDRVQLVVLAWSSGFTRNPGSDEVRLQLPGQRLVHPRA